MKKCNDKLVRELVCNIDGDIYISRFMIKDNFDDINYGTFIDNFISNKINSKNISTEDMVSCFNNFDIKKLSSLYEMLVNDSKGYDVNEFIRNYLEMFTDFSLELFCTGREAQAFVKASRNPIFANKDSKTIRVINMAVNSRLVNDIKNNSGNRKNNTLLKSRVNGVKRNIS